MGIGTILGLRETNPKLYAFKEAMKEVGRYLISIGLVDSVIVIFQLIQSGINTQTGVININWNMVIAFTLFSAVSAIIRGLDKAKHEYEKAIADSSGVSKGFIPF